MGSRSGCLIAFLLSLPAVGARAQGCVATGQSGMIVGSQQLHFTGTPQAPKTAEGLRQLNRREGIYLKKGQMETMISYRWVYAQRHFRGASEVTSRMDAGTQVINHLNLIDLSLEYAATSRWRVAMALPYLIATRSQALSAGGRVVDRAVTESQGIGDLRVIGRYWIGEPRFHLDGNASIGLGVKLPTGNPQVSDTFNGLSSSVNRPVDQSIQPGDSGTGAIFETFAYRKLFGESNAFVQGSYLFNPKNTTGRANGLAAPNDVNTVSDQYLLRVGAAMPLSKYFSTSLANRMEGIPPRDVFGRSDGFRRPGFEIDLEPGLSFSRWDSTLSVFLPIAMYRERQRSVTEEIRGTTGEGAFSDYSFIISLSHRL
jgi:hypothetical protein